MVCEECGYEDTDKGSKRVTALKVRKPEVGITEKMELCDDCRNHYEKMGWIV